LHPGFLKRVFDWEVYIRRGTAAGFTGRWYTLIRSPGGEGYPSPVPTGEE